MNLQRLWAALLASATLTPGSVIPAFPAVLSELSPSDAQFLDWLYRNTPPRVASVRAEGLVFSVAMSEMGISEFDMGMTLLNLHRLNLISTNPAVKAQSDLRGHPLGQISLTIFGKEFIRACVPPSA
jgi:hypothetical protein